MLAAAGLAAGCSSDVTRFAGLYTAAVPAPGSPGAAVSPEYQPYPATPDTYPVASSGVSTVQNGGLLAPPAIDRTTTASITPSTSPVQRMADGAQSLKERALNAMRPSSSRFGPRPEGAVGGVLLQPQVSGGGSLVARQPALPSNTYPAAPQIAAAPVPAPAPVTSRTMPAPSVDMMPTGGVPQAVALDTRSFGGWSANGGTKVTLREGETVYNLARRFGVPANAILKVNGIDKAGAVQTGQQIIIPTYSYSKDAPVSAPDANPQTAAAKASTGTIHDVALEKVPHPTTKPSSSLDATTTASIAPAVPRAADRTALPASGEKSLQGEVMPGDGRYVVKPGDTLTKIASRHGVPVKSLMVANGLDKPDIRIGQALTVPKVDTTYVAGADGVDRSATGGRETAVAAKPTSKAPDNTTTASINALDKAAPAAAPEKTGAPGLRWPAQGRVVTGFKQNDNGKANDGIDIALPKGTPVKAAENGVVIYAGDGLAEFGNTVLIRHDNGLVTVYGHADKLNVSRNQTVKRGDVIALSGNSGKADQPKLHFEVRKNSTPVDPKGYLN